MWVKENPLSTTKQQSSEGLVWKKWWALREPAGGHRQDRDEDREQDREDREERAAQRAGQRGQRDGQGGGEVTLESSGLKPVVAVHWESDSVLASYDESVSFRRCGLTTCQNNVRAQIIKLRIESSVVQNELRSELGGGGLVVFMASDCLHYIHTFLVWWIKLSRGQKSSANLPVGTSCREPDRLETIDWKMILFLSVSHRCCQTTLWHTASTSTAASASFHTNTITFNNSSCQTEELQPAGSALQWGNSWLTAGGAEGDQFLIRSKWLIDNLLFVIAGHRLYFGLSRVERGQEVSWLYSLTHRLFWAPTGTGTPQTGSHSSTPEWRRSWSTARWWWCWCLQTPPGPRTQSHRPRTTWWHHNAIKYSIRVSGGTNRKGIRNVFVKVKMKQTINLKHLLPEQMVPHFPLDVPVDQITLKRKNRKSKWERINRPTDSEAAATARGDALSPSGRGGCKRDPTDLWSHRADWLWRFLIWTSWSETGSLGWHWGRKRGRPVNRYEQLNNHTSVTNSYSFVYSASSFQCSADKMLPAEQRWSIQKV